MRKSAIWTVASLALISLIFVNDWKIREHRDAKPKPPPPSPESHSQRLGVFPIRGNLALVSGTGGFMLADARPNAPTEDYESVHFGKVYLNDVREIAFDRTENTVLAKGEKPDQDPFGAGDLGTVIFLISPAGQRYLDNPEALQAIAEMKTRGVEMENVASFVHKLKNSK